MKSLFIAILTFTFVELIASIPVVKETHNKRSQDNEIQDTRRLLGLLKRFDDVRHLGTRTTEEEATAERDMAVKEEEPRYNQYNKDPYRGITVWPLKYTDDIQEPQTNEKGHMHEAGDYTDRKILTALQKLIEYIQPSD